MTGIQMSYEKRKFTTLVKEAPQMAKINRDKGFKYMKGKNKAKWAIKERVSNFELA